MHKIAIIGGGYAGLNLACALSDKINGEDVVILERKDRVGKKIIATGNGRGNITNSNFSTKFYHSQNEEFFKYALKKYDNESVKKYFLSLGMSVSEDNGKIYPSSFQASSILDLIRLKLENNRVNVLTEFFVKSLKFKDGIYYIESENNQTVQAKYVVLCCGGMAGKQFGTDGSGYALAKQFGHRITPLYPSLVQLKVKENFTKSLKGLKQEVVLSCYNKDLFLKSVRGDLLFTEYGVSGDSVFSISSYVTNLKESSLSIEFLPDFIYEDVYMILKNKVKNNGYLKNEDLLTGIINKQVGRAILKFLNIPLSESVKNTNIKNVVNALKDFRLTVVGSLGFDNAQVTKGGVSTFEVDNVTFESKKQNGLYVVGEMLDVDGDCGGYNLQWAFSSAMCVKDSLLEKIKD